jgi:competence protein ComEA
LPGVLSTGLVNRCPVCRWALTFLDVRSRQREDALAARLVGDRLAHVLGEQQPRRAAMPLAESAPSSAAERGEPPSADAGQFGPQTAEAGISNQSRFNRLHIAVVCVLLALGLVLAVVALLRARPVALATPQTTVSISPYQPSATFLPGGASASSTPATRIVVHVLGAVRRPGLVQLPDRSRVSDAVDAAGGLRSSAEPGDLNLAQIVVDGQQIVIGARGDPGGEVRDGGGGGGAAGSRSPGPAGGSSPGQSTQLDLNAATAAQLDTLPGVGPVTADRILKWRSDHGRFRRLEELQEVEGIGPKTYAQIAPHVRV